MVFTLLRRAKAHSVFGIAGAAFLSLCAVGSVQADPVTVVSWGGSYGKAQDAGNRVCLALTCNVGGRAMYRLIQRLGAAICVGCAQ